MRKISLTFGILLILGSHPNRSGVSDPEKTVADFHDSLTQVLKEKSYESKLSLPFPRFQNYLLLRQLPEFLWAKSLDSPE